MFEGIWGKLKSKKAFQRESVTEYLRLTQVLMWIAHKEKSLIAIFRNLFASIQKTFIFTGRPDTRLSFYVV